MKIYNLGATHNSGGRAASQNSKWPQFVGGQWEREREGAEPEPVDDVAVPPIADEDTKHQTIQLGKYANSLNTINLWDKY